MTKLATKFRPQEQAFARAVRAGYRHAEFWLNAAVLAEGEAVAECAQRFPMSYVLHFPNRGRLEVETLEHCVQLYRALDCRSLVIHQPLFDRHVADLMALEDRLRLAVENHQLSRSEFQRWADRSPYLTLDVEHLWKYTLRDAPLAKLEKCLRKLLGDHGEKLQHVHLPGYLPGCAEHRPMYCSRDMVMMVLSVLEEHGYAGFVVSETAAEFQNDHDLQMDALLFQRWSHVRKQELGTAGIPGAVDLSAS